MLEKIYDFFGWLFFQRNAFNRLIDFCKGISLTKTPLVKLVSSLLVIVELFSGAVFKTPTTPRGEKLDLTGYKLVVDEEFDGDTLNTEIWHHRGEGARRFGYNADSQVRLYNGNMIITGEYLKDGKYGAGWYTGAVALNKWYNKGYFEIKCICNKDPGFWSAFWLQAEHPYDEYSRGGVGGAEIDIFEAMSAGKKTEKARNSVCQTVWCNGVDDDPVELDKCNVGTYYGDNIYKKYNTYGLKWTDDEYIFYINGVETARTSFGLGVSEVVENLIVSLEIPDSLPKEITSNPNYKTEMVVDYVKVWQLDNKKN